MLEEKTVIVELGESRLVKVRVSERYFAAINEKSKKVVYMHGKVFGTINSNGDTIQLFLS